MKNNRTVRILGILLVLVGLIITASVAYRNNERADKKLVFSENTMLSALYNDYKKEYWEAETGRTIDRERQDITTSEGQSYTMLRSVWMSDQATFDKTWDWTQEHLQRKDSLFAWKWGQKPDGSYGVLADEGGRNTATDGDADIAFALLMAAGRWQQQEYLDDARKIIPEIWKAEVITINDTPYLASNDLEKRSATDAVMNPSYFAPYAYREFAKVDTKNDWGKLVDSSYELINASLDDKLGSQSSAQIPPDWFLMNQKTGEIRAPESGNLTTNYSFDAMRTPWRLALDYEWHKDQRARDTLAKMSFLGDEWKQNGRIYSTYTHDGTAVKQEEVPAVYGGSIGYFAVIDREAGRRIYDTKLKSLYDPNDNSWIEGVSYYSDNWAWFGMTLFDRRLDNPAQKLQVEKN